MCGIGHTSFGRNPWMRTGALVTNSSPGLFGRCVVELVETASTEPAKHFIADEHNEIPADTISFRLPSLHEKR